MHSIQGIISFQKMTRSDILKNFGHMECVA